MGNPIDDALGVSAPTTPPKGANPIDVALGAHPPAVEVAHKPGKSKEDARPSPLRTFADAIAVVPALGAAAVDSLPSAPWINRDAEDRKAGYVRDKDALPSALKMLREQGPGAVSDYYDAFGTKSTARHHPNRPLPPPALQATGEFLEQWHNPANALIGGPLGAAMKLGSRGVRAARAASPVLHDSLTALEGAASDVARPFQNAINAVGRKAAQGVDKAVDAVAHAPGVGPIVQGTRELVSRYAPLRQRGGTPYVAAGLAAHAAPEHAEAEVLRDTRARFDGLTRAQKIEVQKLSYYDHEGNRVAKRDPKVPEPAKGPSLEERAAQVRGDLVADDQLLAKHGIRDPDKGELFASGLFFPMRKFRDRPVYSKPELDAAALEGHEVPVNAFPSGTRGRSRFSAGVTKTGSKFHPTILSPDVEAALAPEYDPAHQYQMHRMENRRAIANEQARIELEGVQGVGPDGRPNTYDLPGGRTQAAMARVPLRYALDRPDGELEFGVGEEGKKSMKRYIDAVSRAQARKLAREDPGVQQAAADRGVSPFMLGSRKVVDRNTSPYDARVREAYDALGRISKAQTRATTSAAKVSKARDAEIERVASGLDGARKSLLLGQDALGAALRENGTIVKALSSDLAAHRTDAQGILDILQPKPLLDEKQAARAARDAARGMHADESIVQKPYWDALAQVGGKIKPDLVWDGAAKKWKVAGEFDDIPKRLLGPMKDLPKPEVSNRVNGNMDEITAIVRKAHPEITDDDVRAFFAEKGRKPRIGDFMDDARKRVAAEILPKYAQLGAEDVRALRTELQAALRKVERGQGALEGAQSATAPLSAAARKAQESADLAAGRMGSAAEVLRKGGADPAEAAIAEIERGSKRQADALRDARAKAARVQSVGELAQIYRLTFDRLFDSVKSDVAKDVESTAARAPHGYKKESDLKLGSPSGREMALDDSFARFFEGKERFASGFDGDQAKVFWRVQQVFNRLARASIVFVPTVHGVNNLGMHYLAEGGDVGTMAAILGGKAKFDPALEARAVKSGAVNDFAGHLFGGQDAHAATTERGELADEYAAKAGPFAKAVRPAARGAIGVRDAYGAMNQWLFHNVERGYATDLFDRFTKQGMTDGEAAIKVRNALGKYGDVSPREAHFMADRLFYFYSWMKTVVPFWINKGLIDPKWWQAPVRAIAVNNEAQGYDDPSHPFTATMGRRDNGDFRRVVMPLPQRVLEPVTSLARLPLDAAGALRSDDLGDAVDDAKRPIDWALGHLSLPATLARDAYDRVAASATGRQAAPWNTFQTDPNASGLAQFGEIASKLAGHALSPISTAERAAQDPGAVGLSVLTGGAVYGKSPKEKTDQEHAVRMMFAPAITAAKQAGDKAVTDALIRDREKAVREIDDAYAAAVKARP